MIPSGSPALPYAGTSGWSGSTASRDSTLDQDADGRTRDKQRLALGFLARDGRLDGTLLGPHVGQAMGMTWRELDHLTDWGHGSTSRVLSVLHEAGLVARLSERRLNCSVYVLPEYVNGRETEPHGGRPGLAAALAAIQRVRDLHRPAVGRVPDSGGEFTYCTSPDHRIMTLHPCATVRALDGEPDG